MAGETTITTTRRNGTGRNGTGRNGTGRNGTGRNGTGRGEYAIVDALNHDWGDLVHRDRATVPRWAQAHPVLAVCESLDDVVSTARLDSDATLSALLTEAGAGDQLAGRTVLQTMLGRLINMARRDRQARIDDYIAALWCVIANYPLTARPARIAANLSMDTLKTIYQDRQAFRHTLVIPWPPHRFTDQTLGHQMIGTPQPPGTDQPITAAEVLDAGVRLQLINPPTHRLLHSLYIDGLSSDQAARRHHTTPGSIRVRTSKAVKHLTAHAPQLTHAAQAA